MKNQKPVTSSFIKYLIIVAIIMTGYACNTSLNLLKSNNHAINKNNFTDTINVEFHNNRIILPVEIAGKSRKFLFDTGASTIIFEDLKQELNNTEKKPTIALRSVDGKTRKYNMQQIEQIGIGNKLRFDNVWVIEDNNSIETMLFGLPCKIYDGVIGSDLFRNLSIQLDMQNKRIIVSDKKILPTTDAALKQTMRIKETGHPHIEILVQGKKKSVLFDTGAPQTVMLPGIKQYSDMATDTISSLYNPKGKLLEKEVRFNEILINNVSVKKPQITLTDTRKVPLIGTDILHYACVVLDNKSNEFWLIPYNNSHEITILPGFGFSIDFKSSNTISHIRKGSIAEKNGLKVGFRIIQIDNISLNTDSFCDLYKNLDLGSMSTKETMRIIVLDNEGNEKEFILKQ